MLSLTPLAKLEQDEPVTKILLSECKDRRFNVLGIDFDNCFVAAKRKGDREPRSLQFYVQEFRGTVEFFGCMFKFNAGG